MRAWLPDTGPLVAYLDVNDLAHRRAVSCLDGFSGQLCTTSTVITETMYLVRSVLGGPERLAEFAEGSGMLVHECA